MPCGRVIIKSSEDTVKCPTLDSGGNDAAFVPVIPPG
jgi:hypothetical protein